jgi:hypothetical protein
MNLYVLQYFHLEALGLNNVEKEWKTATCATAPALSHSVGVEPFFL